MLWEIARDPYFGVLPIASIGGIANWRDAAEFRTLGAGSVQVCTAAMHKGFKIVEDMIDGLGYWMDEKGYRTLDDFRAAAIPNVTDWQQLDMNYEIVARINQDLCIKCGLCHVACEDTSHQAVAAQKENGSRRYEVIDTACDGCNLCLR